ncbi:hypothetical protein SG34_014790 [Thalassomonas viridans]|uniref:Uncharacterized protein n=1 Tax=Thalassomonas viridans TaxID=137584 RepID=A0AAE9Z8J6_9GAMM|nr:hypothetical protein [Thalassomonas viridans]WDE08045.1 hypothetical protein SG34_014790 [Thalassomonas viridans]
MNYSLYLSSEEQAPTEATSAVPETLIGPPGQALIGCWANTNKNSREILRFEIREKSPDDKDSALLLTVHSAADDGEKNWGESEITTLFEDNINKAGFDAFIAEYHFDGQQVRLQANMNLGLLIMTALHTYKGEGGQRNYFSREYFRRQSVI